MKFLADARDAVYRLNNDQATAKQLKEQGERQEKELAAAKKAVTDSVNQTIKKRRSEIDTSYDKEIAKGQERLKKARTQREKAKNKGMKERIAEETSELREHNRDLQIQMKTMFQKDKVPVFCRTLHNPPSAIRFLSASVSGSWKIGKRLTQPERSLY